MLKNKEYYNLILNELKKDDILENFEKANGKITKKMEIDVADPPENIDQKSDSDKGIYAFVASFDYLDVEVGIVLDINELKPLSPFWMIKQENSNGKVDKKAMKFFLETLAENLEEGKTNFPLFVFYNDKNKFSVSPNVINPLDILEK